METTLNPQEIIVRETSDAADLALQPKPVESKKRAGAFTGKPDRWIWGFYIGLLIISLLESYSASSVLIKDGNIYGPLWDQAKFLGIGLGIVIALEKLHYKWFRKYAYVLFAVSAGLLVYSTFFGEEINGAKRAISLLGFTIQPPEIIKLTMVLFLSRLLASNQEPGGVKTKGVVIATFAVLAIGGLLWFNGLTNVIMLILISISLFIISGIQWKKLGILMLIFSMFGLMVYKNKYTGESDSSYGRHETHIERISRFIKGIDPDDPTTDENRQVKFSYFAQAHGGFFGSQISHNESARESSRLPLAFSDFIFAIIVEDGGFFLGILLMVLYLSILARAGRVTRRCRFAFPAFLIMGCAVMIVLQALIHMVIVVGGPVSGQPLPFISHGGTSILVMSAAIGMMLSVSRFSRRKNTAKERAKETSELPDEMLTVNPSMIEPN